MAQARSARAINRRGKSEDPYELESEDPYELGREDEVSEIFIISLL